MSIPIHRFIDPVDRSRSISTVNKDSPTGEYGRYRRSIRIKLQRITVDRRWWIKIRNNFVVDFIDHTINTCANYMLARRVSPPDPRPEGRESRLFFDFLGRESTPEAKKGEKGPRVGSSGREFASNVNPYRGPLPKG